MSLYKPDSTQNAAQYAIAPFRTYTISLANINRSQGQFFPEYEGGSFYCEHTDFPALVSFVNRSTGLRETYPMRHGLQINAPFKGLFITHPFLTPSAPASLPISAKFIIGAGCATISNELAHPIMGGLSSYRIVAGGSALLRAVAIAIPPGARFLENLQVGIGVVATVTWALADVMTDFNNLSARCDCPQYVANGHTYDGINAFGETLDVVVGPGVGPHAYVSGANIFLPTYATEVKVSIIGTGLDPVGYVKANFS